MTEQHAPTPWDIGTSETRYLDGSPPTHNYIIVDKFGRLVADFGSKQKIGTPLTKKDTANIEFIVEAVNRHAALEEK